MNPPGAQAVTVLPRPSSTSTRRVSTRQPGWYDARSNEQPTELFDLLAKLRGSFLMRLDDCQQVRVLAREHRSRVERAS